MLAQFDGGNAMAHATRGNEREVFVRQFLQQVFPASMRFPSGQVIDSHGRTTGQIDVAIELPQMPSLPLAQDAPRLLLADSIAGVIEVKSNVAKQWKQVVSTARRVRRLQRRQMDGSFYTETEDETRVPIIAVGFCGYATSAAIESALSSTPVQDRPDGVYVIESDSMVMAKDLIGEGTPIGLWGLLSCITYLMARRSFMGINLLDYWQKPS